MLNGDENRRNRLIIAFVAYAALGVSAGVTLEGLFRYAVWLFLGALAVKTLLVWWAQKQL